MHNLVVTSKDAPIATKVFLNYIDDNQVVKVEKISVSLYSISTLRFYVHVKSTFYFRCSLPLVSFYFIFLVEKVPGVFIISIMQIF